MAIESQFLNIKEFIEYCIHKPFLSLLEDELHPTKRSLWKLQQKDCEPFNIFNCKIKDYIKQQGWGHG